MFLVIHTTFLPETGQNWHTILGQFDNYQRLKSVIMDHYPEATEQNDLSWTFAKGGRSETIRAIWQDPNQLSRVKLSSYMQRNAVECLDTISHRKLLTRHR